MSRTLGLVMAAALLAGCSSHPRFVLFLDPFQQEVWKQEGLDQTELRRIAAGRFTVDVEVYSPAQADRVRRSLLDRSPTAAYLSPLLGLSVSSLASALPGTTLVSESPAQGSNTVTVSFESEQAYARAGAEVGSLLADERAWVLFRSFLAVGEPPRCGVLLASPGPTARREMEAFRRGFQSTAPPGSLEVRELSDLADKGRARQAMEKLRDAGAVIFLLKTYTLTGFCLEVLQERGGWAVIEDWWQTGAYDDVLLLTIRDDWRQAFRSVFQRLAPQSTQMAMRAKGPVSAPVRLRWGKRARSLMPSLSELPQK